MAGLSEGNMTGLSPNEARKNIDDFSDAMYKIGYDLMCAVDYLYNELYYVWASPKAVEFNKYRDNYDNISRFVGTSRYEISQNAIRLYNTMARANGLDEITNADGDSLDNVYNTAKDTAHFGLKSLELVTKKDDQVGMNTLQVPNIRDAFVSKINDVLVKIDEVPSRIAIFDPDGAIQSAFSGSIERMKDSVGNLVSKMREAIDNALETERINLKLAAKPMDAGYTSTNA